MANLKPKRNASVFLPLFSSLTISRILLRFKTAMLIIPIVGCILGWLADIVMTHIGIDLKHRELAEK